MDSLIQISKLNDFLYSPKSLYFHSVYEAFGVESYHQKPQTEGRINHEKIDTKAYSTAKKYLQGITVYSEKLGLIGKIDLYDQDSKTLIERKTKIKQIFDGYKFQLFAQFYCLTEMGYQVDFLELFSLKDNKKYKIELPNAADFDRLCSLIEKIRGYDIYAASRDWQQTAVDEVTIYKELYF